MAMYQAWRMAAKHESWHEIAKSVITAASAYQRRKQIS